MNTWGFFPDLALVEYRTNWICIMQGPGVYQNFPWIVMNSIANTIFCRDGMLKLDDHDSVDGHSKGALRSLDINQPTYVGGIPHPDEMKLGNRTHIAINLGLTKIAGNFLFFPF